MLYLRDTQRQKVYGAEENWVACTIAQTTADWQFESIEHVCDYLNPLCYKFRLGGIYVKHNRAKLQGSYTHEGRLIELSDDTFGMSQRVVLHELAHHMTAIRARKPYQAHGPEFTRNLATLVDSTMGHYESRELVEQYAFKKVRVKGLDKSLSMA